MEDVDREREAENRKVGSDACFMHSGEDEGIFSDIFKLLRV
jgi:hypothetical protein